MSTFDIGASDGEVIKGEGVAYPGEFESSIDHELVCIAEHIKTTALIIHKFSQNPNIDKTMCFPAEKLLLNLPKLIRIFAHVCFGNIIASAAG